jgi:hypothetical protein
MTKTQLTMFDKTPTGTYYNTNNLKGEELKEKKEKVVGQTGEILHVFASNPKVWLSPWDVYDKTGCRFPITSVRRAISNLEDKGFLVKSQGTKPSGPYNDKSHTWQLDPNQL